MRAILRSGFLALAIMALAVPADAGPIEEAKAAWFRREKETALNILRPVAEQGHADAQILLAVMLSDLIDEGLGGFEFDAEILKWSRRAAEQGYTEAQARLGEIYANGRGVPQHYGEAVKWHRMAAEQGSSLSQNALGTLFEKGYGVPQDYIAAHMWFNLVAAQGHKNAQENREKVAKQMTPDQITEAQELARKWWAKHQQ